MLSLNIIFYNDIYIQILIVNLSVISLPLNSRCNGRLGYSFSELFLPVFLIQALRKALRKVDTFSIH